MISVSEALKIIHAARPELGTEIRPVLKTQGLRSADNVKAKLTQPPFDASAMDGYAVKLADVTHSGAILQIIGEAPAGTPFAGTVGAGEAVRIFTGSPLPKGADHILIQENATRDGAILSVDTPSESARHIRRAGIDFKTGDTLIPKGKIITAADIALASAGNHAELRVQTRPRVAIIASGDELREPGSTLGPGQIISSNSSGLAAYIKDWGGIPKVMGIARDNIKSIRALIDDAGDADIFLPIGGASVGDYDFMKAAFIDAGFSLSFEKVAVRPGKPTWFGTRGPARVLGLPGNPASAYVCAHVFLKALMGAPQTFHTLPLTNGINANGPRETFLRGEAKLDTNGQVRITAFPRQDSSLITPLAKANVLIRLPANAGPWQPGDKIDTLSLSAQTGLRLSS